MLIGGNSEHAEAGQADRCGKQEVSGDLDQPADPRAAAAVAAAHEMADLTFDLGLGRPVVRLPGRVCLAFRAAASRASCGPMVIVRPSLALAWAASGQVRQAPANLATRGCRPEGGRMGTMTSARQVTVLPSRSMVKRTLGK